LSCIWDGVVGTGQSNGMLRWNAIFDGREVCFLPDKAWGFYTKGEKYGKPIRVEGMYGFSFFFLSISSCKEKKRVVKNTKVWDGLIVSP